MERLVGRIILLWGWRRALVAFLAGLVAVPMQAPFDFFAVGFVSFPILVWLIDGATVAPASGLLRRLVPVFAVGCWFGFGYFLGGLWWIGSALLVEAESFAWALPFAVLGVPLILSLFYGLAAVIAHLFWSNNIGRIAALALGFGIAEWLRGFVLTGFPWNPVGLGAMPMPVLMQSVWLVGMIGINALAVFVFAMPGLLAGRRDRVVGLLIALALCAAHAGFGYWRLDRPVAQAQSTLSVRVVQPSVAMNEKWDPAEQDRVFTVMMKDSAAPPESGAQPPQLIVWPETSVPFILTERPDALTAIGNMLGPGQLLAAGAVRAEERGASDPLYYNAVVAIDDVGQITDAVDKVHLVPFGEYIPFAGLINRLGLKQIIAGPMNFAAGADRHALKIPGGTSAVPFICYEIIFPDLVADAVMSSNLIINVTNDAWFGNTPGPYQHLRQAQIRAVETGLPVVRAANTGISAVIDPRGRIVDALAIGERGNIDVSLALSPPPTPPYPPRQVGFAILASLAAFALLMRLRQKLRPN